jgi:dihydroorotate dehydrogenase
MANSFGVPSLDPAWWMEDVRKARTVVREGHQVLIVSVVASVNASPDSIVDDFVKVALLAKKVGADIIEANYSCPNVPDDPVGEVYQVPELAGRISKALQEALAGGERETPLFVKIGYLPEPQLRDFMEHNADYINGVVAINTFSAKVVNEDGEPTFPGRPRAGVSGSAIKGMAQEVVRNLVRLRSELHRGPDKQLTILGVGGVITAKDAQEYLDIGADGVESCTGAFLNPNLGLAIRSEEGIAEKKRAQ